MRESEYVLRVLRYCTDSLIQYLCNPSTEPLYFVYLVLYIFCLCQMTTASFDDVSSHILFQQNERRRLQNDQEEESYVISILWLCTILVYLFGAATLNCTLESGKSTAWSSFRVFMILRVCREYKRLQLFVGI